MVIVTCADVWKEEGNWKWCILHPFRMVPNAFCDKLYYVGKGVGMRGPPMWPASMSYVGWVCFWLFYLVLREVFSDFDLDGVSSWLRILRGSTVDQLLGLSSFTVSDRSKFRYMLAKLVGDYIFWKCWFHTGVRFHSHHSVCLRIFTSFI